mmetsp:Transcript_16779/g.19018  ORF Transcript_16779/g.19018 Transcript_16779/m.19018 type:complete len:331 (+) Transcript_16779:127-1119(+)
MERCLRIGEATPLCGVKGTCVNASICVCDEGWEKSTELAFYLTQEQFDLASEGVIDDTLVCNLQPTVLKFLYALALFSTVAVFSFQARFIRTRRHVRRVSPFLACCMASVLFCVARLIHLERNVGQDVLVTVLWAVVHVSGNFAVLFFNNRFIIYQAKATKELVPSPRFNPRNLKRLQVVLSFLDLLVGVLIISSSVVKLVETSRRLFKAVFGIFFCRSLYQIWAIGYFTNFIIQDFDKIINQDNEMATEDEYDIKIVRREELIRAFKRSRQGLKIVYFSLLFAILFMLFFLWVGTSVACRHCVVSIFYALPDRHWYALDFNQLDRLEAQ